MSESVFSTTGLGSRPTNSPGLAASQTNLAKSQADLSRIRPLAEMDAVSQQDLDSAVAQANPVAMQVLAAVTGLAHNLGISVCAEGVEDQETCEFLKTIKCDKMQGFLISEAVMPDIIRRVYSPKTEKVEDVA